MKTEKTEGPRMTAQAAIEERDRAESARRLWQAKRMEVAYAGARLRAQGMAPAQDPALAALVARVERVEAAIALREVARG